MLGSTPRFTDLVAMVAAATFTRNTSGHVNFYNAGLDSGPCPAQFFARSPAQRAKRRARNGRK